MDCKWWQNAIVLLMGIGIGFLLCDISSQASEMYDPPQYTQPGGINYNPSQVETNTLQSVPAEYGVVPKKPC